MNNFRVISKTFYPQYGNYDFALSTWTYGGVSNDRLNGNVGETIQLIEVIEVSTIVNESKSIDMTYVDNTTSASLIAPFLDFQLEGLFVGADLLIEFNGASIVGKVEEITGSSNQNLVLDSATRTLLIAENIDNGACYDDIVIKLTAVPDYLTYKYGVNPNDLNASNYISPLDSNEQAYYLNGITAINTAMIWIGSEIGSSMGDVAIKFDSTVDSYKHAYTVEHTFIIPFYTEEESNDINQIKNPKNLQSSNTLRYGNGFFFGYEENNTTMTYEDLGEIGNVGYFNENFSGKIAPYEVLNYSISNSLGTSIMEATVDNTVTFSLKSNTATGFVGGETIILNHSMLPQSNEYGRQKTSFNSNWLFESVEVVEGAGVFNGVIITNATVTLNAGDLDVQMTTRYSADDQLKIKTTNQALIYTTIATENLASGKLQDRSNVMPPVGPFGLDEQVNGLVTQWQPNIYEQWDSVSLTKGFTNFDGFNGDLLYQTGTFDLDLTKTSRIVDFKFRLIADDGSSNFLETQVEIPVGQVVESTIGGVDFQVFNYDNLGQFNFDSALDINRIVLSSVKPVFPYTSQTWNFSIGFNVSWRDWIQNLNVPTSFIDTLEPNDNRNLKSSNYSGVDGYDINTELLIRIQSDGTQGGTVITPYELLSDTSRILDYDTPNASFSAGVVNYYNELNVLSTDLSTTSDGRIEIEFPHSLGIIPVGDLSGYIKIEIDQSNIEPFYLSTDLDLTGSNNPLIPSDTLATSNTQFVEVVSVNNLVTFICEIDSSKLTSGVDYNIYGRISNNT